MRDAALPRAAYLRRDLDAALRQRAALRPPPRRSIASTLRAAARAGLCRAAAGGARAGDGALRDAKDGVHLLPPLNRGMSAARAEPELAIRELTAVLNEDPGLLDGPAHPRGRVRGRRTARARGRRPARSSKRTGSSRRKTRSCSATTCGLAGRTAEAATVLERAARENPKFAQPLLSLAEVRIQEGKHADAAALCERVLKLVPDHIEALRRLGDLALLRERHLRPLAPATAASSSSMPDDVPAMTKLGVVSMRSGRADRGDGPVPPGGRARAEQWRGAAVSRRRARLRRASR